MYNHYLRTDENKVVIKAFCSAFEQPLETDFLYEENSTERHFHLPISDEGKYLYKINEFGILEERTEDEKYPIDEQKEDLKKKVNEETKKKILEKYPLEIQLSVALGVEKYQGIKTEMTEFIEEMIMKSDTVNKNIDKKTKKKDLNILNITEELDK